MTTTAVLQQKARRAEWFWPAGLVILGLVSRLPFLTRILYHWDAVNFTLALAKYDIAHHQPQPPGYLLYVLLGRLSQLIFPDPNRALQAVSVLSSIGAALAIYYLGRRMFDQRSAAAASLLLLLSPLIWFYSEIAKPNIIDAPMVTLAALLLWQVMRGEDRLILPAAVVLGLAGGFRQQTLVFLAPLAVFAFRKKRFSQMAAGAAVTALVFLASFVPMVLLAGGWQQYQAAVKGLTGTFFTHTSILMGGGLQGLISNVIKWVSFTAYSLLAAGLALALWLLANLRRLPRALRDERTWFLACWILPSLLFYTLIHMGSHGLIFTYLPAVLLLAGKALADLAGWAGRRSFAVFSVLLTGVVAAGVLVFLAAPQRITPSGSARIVNLETLREADSFFANRFDLLHAHFDPATTLVITEQWRHAQVYLPEYTVLSAPCTSSGEGQGLDGMYLIHGGEYRQMNGQDVRALLPPGLTTLVLFDGPQGCYFPADLQPQMQILSQGGEDLYSLRLDQSAPLSYTSAIFQVDPPSKP